MNAKILALMMVGVMMVSGFSIIADADENTLDAVVGDGGAYSYTLHYDSSTMTQTAAQELQLTVAGMTPISHSSGSSQLALENEGSWGFNTTTGIGPFNSFYAAFDADNGNQFIAVLDPYHLGQTLDGTLLSSMSGHINVMWVLPTVYWAVDENGDLTLSNQSSNGVAYAHTIDGKVYNFLAIGVYEASRFLSDGVNYLASTSGSSPEITNRMAYRTMAHNYTMDQSLGSAHSMLWNFYQWELYKYCSLIVMEGFDSQAIVGNGMVYGTGSSSTLASGLANDLGPYAGNPNSMGPSGAAATTYGTNVSKLFIENSWGNTMEFVDGIVVNANTGFYLDTSNTPSDSTSGDYVEWFPFSLPSSNYGSEISVSDKIWGIPTQTVSTWSSGTTDRFASNTGSTYAVTVGGGWANLTANSYQPGISNVHMAIGLSSSQSNMSSRLAFVFDASPLSSTVSFDVNNADYGSLINDSEITASYGAIIEISDNNLTIGDTTVTATPTTADAQYTYAFSGWYDGETLLVDGDTVSSDMTITAVFTRTVNQYTATISNLNPGFGTVSVSSVTADYGSAISAASNVLTVGASTVTATPTTADAQYTYAFGQWGSYPATLTQDVTITVSFTQTVNTYTITWVYGLDSATETYLYGTMPSFPDPTPPADYRFAGWSPALAPVTQDQTYTAIFELINYLTVTFDPNGGTLEGPDTKVVGQYLPYGELPVPKLDNYVFLGWFTAPEDGEKITATSIVEVDDDQTLYAQWKLGGFPALMEKLLYIFPILLLSILALAILRVFV